ncbi:LacI family transcriptional regulator [Sedimentibacter acidaminivorans]|jgi:LacI family transcriptional regulator, galactose operon repressor|uniref:LacI family transcriptional regulator n=1 Tax=Sedimentibacter acidaminivorans TaxID=913099 RepID=A0ABS4GDA6_9FIRM|nr:LacI family DNA-binding transcriptional regulator [Sedimentibacter acidaminivorans]MBP1925685.1 LacI family transcriptional regulator [Sedimentibacter acidaminivorans]
MITIKDVARLSEVSISTVSRVINDSKPVSPEVRRRVLKVIEETGYKPNDVARSLVTRRSYLIGVIVNNLAQSYVADIVRGIEEIGKMYGYDILLCSSYSNKETQEKYLQLLDRKQAEGLFLVGNRFDSDVLELAKSLGKPSVFFTRDVNDSMNYISIDSSAAIYEMTNYLINEGHENIAFISDFENRTSVENDKISGYMKAIEDNELDYSKVFVAGSGKHNKAYELGKTISKDSVDFTAAVCSSDEIAIGIMNSFSDNGINVPNDVSVVGYGNIREGRFVRPELTTIGEPYYDVGAVGMRMLIKTIKGDRTQKGLMELPFTIEKRNSVKTIK